jgi:hypothetical protein
MIRKSCIIIVVIIKFGEKMILILDIDGTLADFSHRLKYLKKKNITQKDMDTFLNSENVKKDSSFLDAKEVLPKLLGHFYATWFITGRQESLRECTREWLKKHYKLNVPNNRLIMRKNGELSTATEYKKKALKGIFGDFLNTSNLVFIDDDEYVLNLYSKYGIALKAPDCWKILNHKKPEEDELIFTK